MTTLTIRWLSPASSTGCGSYPGRRLVLVFQPHTLTRTRALFDDFVSVLRAPEQVAVLDVYAGRESDDLAEPGRLAVRLRRALREQDADVLERRSRLRSRRWQPGIRW